MFVRIHAQRGQLTGANYDMRGQLSWPLFGYVRLGHSGRVANSISSVSPNSFHVTRFSCSLLTPYMYVLWQRDGKTKSVYMYRERERERETSINYALLFAALLRDIGQCTTEGFTCDTKQPHVFEIPVFSLALHFSIFKSAFEAAFPRFEFGYQCDLRFSFKDCGFRCPPPNAQMQSLMFCRCWGGFP